MVRITVDYGAVPSEGQQRLGSKVSCSIIAAAGMVDRDLTILRDPSEADPKIGASSATRSRPSTQLHPCYCAYANVLGIVDPRSMGFLAHLINVMENTSSTAPCSYPNISDSGIQGDGRISLVVQ